ncbi:PREDICTED: phospholipase A1-II 1-like [Ipomoea nil]|uniref:phospholipase A1-II 1-like n=1 Tax=Ipomoea nil TaxID=35883 RepID=UPI0009014369|nr:PREDICTED: phospholipase A1-II 1-like [Ipomoea nil]XP_019175984.1 PREDICTED: phospholipase A1-II 1-like [Ipomoea nil]
MESIAKRWRVLNGSDNWEGLLDPLDSDLRRYLIHYGSMIGAVYDSFISEPTSKYAGLSRYAKKSLLEETGLEKANPFKYTITKYFYTPSTTCGAHHGGYHVQSVRADAVMKESNWGGYVAVATDKGKEVLGRRDILVVWRGTETRSEWIEDFRIPMVKPRIIFAQDNGSLVHRGWYEMYTSTNQDSHLNSNSARDQVRAEVCRLLDLYKNEEVSITVTGHSLGSSLATLNAVDLAANPFNNTDVLITAFLFASPKVGNEGFKKAFSHLKNLRALRVVNNGDLVPMVPFLAVEAGTILPLIAYKDVGVQFDINASKSEYVKHDKLNVLMWHGLMIYLHGIDGFQGPKGEFKPQGCFDIPQVNKYGGMLKVEKCPVPTEWWVEKNKGMVQQDDGTWILDDHEADHVVFA